MSLINEALKKAQKLRTGETAASAPMPGESMRVTKRGAPRSTQQLVLIAVGSLVLIVLSVVGTFWFINRTPPPPSAPKPAAAKPAAAAASPGIVAPVLKPAVTTPELPPAKPAAPPVATDKPAAPAPEKVTAITPAPAPVDPTPPAPAPSPTPVATPPPAPFSTASATPAAPTTDPRVHEFVDKVKVGGIRSSGDDSRVLMNDRVFRVNDIVDRNLGIRLTKVEPSALTFTDANGAVYVKNF